MKVIGGPDLPREVTSQTSKSGQPPEKLPAKTCGGSQISNDISLYIYINISYLRDWVFNVFNVFVYGWFILPKIILLFIGKKLERPAVGQGGPSGAPVAQIVPGVRPSCPMSACVSVASEGPGLAKRHWSRALARGFHG